jgi:hypothetical protein
MPKIVQEFSASLDKFLAPLDDVLIVAFSAVLALLAQMFGFLP